MPDPFDAAAGTCLALSAQRSVADIVTVDQLASELRVNRKTLYEAFRRSERVPGVGRIGARIIIDRTAFLAALAHGEVDIG